MQADLAAFIRVIRDQYRVGRRSFPWRETRDAYPIFVSELMLQQTRTDRVLGKWEPFLRRFPSWQALAAAETGELYRMWKGLGYNRRALYLRECARIILERWGGRVPDDPAVLRTLPGIGAATAGSLCAFIHDKPVPFIETNIRRVFIHFFFGYETEVSDPEILPLVEATMDEDSPREWYYALMDYGAFLGKGIPNPNRKSSGYVKQGKFEGSNRHLRGRLLSRLSDGGPADASTLAVDLGVDVETIGLPLSGLIRDGFVRECDGLFGIGGDADGKAGGG